MLNNKNEISLLYDLSTILAQELIINESDDILGAISNIEKGNKVIKQIVNGMQTTNITNTVSLDNSLQHLEKNFNKNIQQLKTIKKLISVAKKYSQEPVYSFQNHSLISVLEILNIFFNKKILNDNGLKYDLDEMIYEIKYDCESLEKTYAYIDISIFKNDEQILGYLSYLHIYTGNINCNIEYIQKILLAPPRIKKTKKQIKSVTKFLVQ